MFHNPYLIPTHLVFMFWRSLGSWVSVTEAFLYYCVMVKHNTTLAAEHTSSVRRCSLDSGWRFVITRPLVKLHGSFNCRHLQRLKWPNFIYHVELSKKIWSALSVNLLKSHGVKLHLHTIGLFLLFFLCRSREVLCLKARVRERITLRWDLKPAVYSHYIKFDSQYDVLWHKNHWHGWVMMQMFEKRGYMWCACAQVQQIKSKSRSWSGFAFQGNNYAQPSCFWKRCFTPFNSFNTLERRVQDVRCRVDPAIGCHRTISGFWFAARTAKNTRKCWRCVVRGLSFSKCLFEGFALGMDNHWNQDLFLQTSGWKVSNLTCRWK